MTTGAALEERDMRVERFQGARRWRTATVAVLLAVLVVVGASGPAGAGDSEDAARAKLLDRVTVFGSSQSARRNPGSVDRVTHQQLEEQNQAFDDIHRVLLRLPGVHIQEEDGYGLRPNIGMRGTGSERSAGITLMEDGVLIAPAPYAAPAAYYFPVTGRMDAVEVRKGSSSIKYGPRTNGGALNLISTPVPNAFRLHLKPAVGSHQLKKFSGSYGDAHGPVGWLVETYQMETDGFKRLDSGGETGFDLQDYIAKLRLSSGLDAGIYQELTLKFGYKEETSRATYLGLTQADFDADPYRRYSASQRDLMTNRHRQFQARHFIQATDRIDITTTAYRNEFERNWYKLDKVTAGGSTVGIGTVLEDPETYPDHYQILLGELTSADDALAVKANAREYFSQGVETLLGLDLDAGASRHQVEVGARLHQDEEDRFQFTDGYRMEADAGSGTQVLTTKGVPGAAGGGDNRVNAAWALALFAQDRITWGEWTLTPGLRLESIHTEREQYGSGDIDRLVAPTVTKNSTDVLIPGIGAHYQINEPWGVFAGVHRGFAPPGPGADDSTQAEKSWNVETGVRYQRGTISGRVTGFFSDYSNLLGKDTFSSGGTGSGDLFNAGEVEVVGIEAGMGWNALGGDAGVAVPIEVNYTFTRATFQSAFSSGFEPWGDVAAGDRLPYLPEHQLGVGVGVEQPRWRVSLFANIQSKMRTRAGQGDIPDEESTDARMVLDASAEYGLSPTARAFVSVQNLADESYVAARRPAGLRPGLPRMVAAGVKVTL